MENLDLFLVVMRKVVIFFVSLTSLGSIKNTSYNNDNNNNNNNNNNVYVLPVVIGALGGGIKALGKDLKKVFHNNELSDEVVARMRKTVLMDSESIMRRVMSGLIQGEEDE